MSDQELLSYILFAETKDMHDAIAIANVIKNRAMNPKRYGEGIQGVITKPKQFSGLNSPEFKKAQSGKLTSEEQEIMKGMNAIARSVIIGAVGDSTEGATYYFNPKLVKPKWSENMTKQMSTDYHEYYKE